LFRDLPPEAWAEWQARLRCARRALIDALPGGGNATKFQATGLEPVSGKVEVAWPDRSDKFTVHTTRQDDYIYATYAGPSGGQQ